MRKKASVVRFAGVNKPSHAAPAAALASPAARAALASNFSLLAPTHIYTSPDGVRGEVLRLRPPRPPRPARKSPLSTSTSAPHTHIIFLPGNPGVIECYRRYICDLADRLPQDVRSTSTVHALGLPGHDLRALSATRLFTIADHIAYVRAYLAHLSAPSARIVFHGHSYGSYLSLRILALEPSLAPRARLIMLMPAVHEMSASRPPKVRLVTDDTAGALLTPLANAVAALTPRSVTCGVLKTVFGCDDADALAAAARMFDGQRVDVYRNCLSLAREEMRVIRDVRNEKSAAAVGEKRAFLYWTEDDAWCTAESVKAIRGAFGDLTVYHAKASEGVTHAFSVSLPQIRKVAACVASWIAAISRESGD